MPGLGTIINTAAIVAGGLLGLLFKNLLTKSMEDTLLKASSVCVLFIGIGSAMSQMLAYRRRACDFGQHDAHHLLCAGWPRRRAFEY
ncbi:MAG: DUF554 family protein [Oscillospiraceae bacterium]